jgi:hypothetical protein
LISDEKSVDFQNPAGSVQDNAVFIEDIPAQENMALAGTRYSFNDNWCCPANRQPNQKCGRPRDDASESLDGHFIQLHQLHSINSKHRHDGYISGRVDLRRDFRQCFAPIRPAKSDMDKWSGGRKLLIVPIASHRDLLESNLRGLGTRATLVEPSETRPMYIGQYPNFS